MLDYLNRHEQHLAEALKDYESGAAKGIMDTWLQYTPELDAHELLERVRDMDINNVEVVVATALATDEYLREIYEEVAQRTDLDDLREVARSLRQIESNEQYRLARDALRFSDL
jgi:CheY-like chemotaxis protein